MSPLLVVTGTGTEIGKTHVSRALLLSWQRVFPNHRLAGLKPVESGLNNGIAADGSMLEQLSTFHVKHLRAPYLLERPVSPHLAARQEGRSIETTPILEYVNSVRAEADGVLVELAGGLFSPLAPNLTNADVAKALAPDAVLLVAPDRLGVLHDITAAYRAAGPNALDGVILVRPATPDSSTGTNAAELSVVCPLPVVAEVPRGEVESLDLAHVIRRFVR